MNISLAGATTKRKKTKKGTIGYGLNERGKSNISDAFDGSSSSDDDDGDDVEEDTKRKSSNHRAKVNRQIAKEQEALRRRARIAASSVDASVYDYDGAYDSFRPAEKVDSSEGKEEKKSRYIGGLLKAAKKRARESDLVYERKVAKEQAEEDMQADYRGKEKFVTRAYKRKLEERKQWELEESRKDQEEEKNDVTKKVAGTAFASFYGNFNRNVAVGGANSEGGKDASHDENLGKETKEEPRKSKVGFLDGFARSEEDRANNSTDDNGNDKGNQVAAEPEEKPSAPVLSHSEKREKKVLEARRRYLARRAAAVA